MANETTEIFAVLEKEKAFFRMYQDTFIQSFQHQTKQLKPGLLSATALNTFSAKVYQLLFSLRDDPRLELAAFSKKTLSHGVDIRPIILKSLLIMLSDFTKHVSGSLNIEAAAALARLIALYARTVNTEHAAFTQKKPATSATDTSPPIMPQRTQRYKEAELILERLKSAETEGESIELITYVHEVPVSCTALLLGQTAEFFEADTKNCTDNLFTPDREVFIKHASFPKTVSGKAHYFPGRQALRFRDPYFTELPQEGRKFLRVATEAPIPVTLNGGGSQFMGRIKDLSIGGIGIITIDKLPFMPEERLRISFRLLDNDLSFDLTIKYNIQEERIFRIGTAFDPGYEQEALISEYVTERQFAILEALSEHQD